VVISYTGSHITSSKIPKGSYIDITPSLTGFVSWYAPG